jgi:hypothetical protein
VPLAWYVVKKCPRQKSFSGSSMANGKEYR